MLSRRENYLRTARLEGGEYIPCGVGLSHAMRAQCGAELEEVMARHEWLFPGFEPGRPDFDNYQFPVEERVGELVDPWGCTWRMAYDGVIGTVVEHPLADWSALEKYRPAPVEPQNAQRITGDWQSLAEDFAARAARGELTSGGLYHGFLFMRLTYLRGFDNFLCDLVEQPPELLELIDMVKAHCAEIVRRFLQMDLDVLGCGEDLGAQNASIISTEMFRQFFTPVYRELFAPAKDAGKLVYLHSDGHVLELMDEFADAGIDIINPQDLVNGIDNLAAEAKGRFCIDLDIDRQSVVPFGSPGDIEDLVAEAVRKLGGPAGGLMLKAGVYPPTPPENVDALCSAMKKVRTYYWE